MNRGSEPIEEHVYRPIQASMRPRFMNRGSAQGNVAESDPHRGFNEAPIHESGKYASSSSSGSAGGWLQ